MVFYARSFMRRGGIIVALVAVLTVPFPGAQGEQDRALAGEGLPTAAEMMGWIEEIYGQGIRRPGYPADDWAVEWARDGLEAAGCKVELEPIEVLRWGSKGCRLRVWPAGDEAHGIDLPCMAIPFSTPTDGLEAEIVANHRLKDLTGKIVLKDLRFLALPQLLLKYYATDDYDPEGVFWGLAAKPPHTQRAQAVMDPEVDKGAAGFIGALWHYPRETHDRWVPYDARVRPIPGVYVSPRTGKRIKALMIGGPIEGRIAYSASTEPWLSYNVIGRLEGASDDWIIVGTHHDGPWGSAVEDASGMALVMAQAHYWGSLAPAERPHNLLFIWQGGHMSGGAGSKSFVSRHQEFIANDVVVEIHLEHVARRAVKTWWGQLRVTDEPEVRWWFVNRNPTLEAITKGAIVANDLTRSFIFDPEKWPPGRGRPPTDGAQFYGKVPIVQHITTPWYLFDSWDTPDKVHEPSLVPLTKAVIQIVEALAQETASSLRAKDISSRR
jgi:hypothetical protein